MTEYIIQSTASSISASANSTYNWAAQMVAFRPASLGGNPTPINNPPPSATTTLPITQISSGNSNLDMYGGSTSLQCPSGPKATFYTQKIGNRWVFCDPLGNVFWMKAVYVLDSTDGGNTYNSIISNKYTAGAWPQQTLTRLKSWGFNTVGPYAGLGGHNMLPVSTYGSQANPVKMPFLRQIELSNWCLPQTKNIYSESNPVVYSSNNQFPDVYDPAWIACVNTVATNSGDPSLFGNNLSQNANYMIGTWIGDTDYLAGFNRGPATPGGAAPHLGWIAATTNPAPGGSTNYTKQAWQNYIQKKYSTIAALNTAWGSNYTSFASAGGWPKKTTKGSGLLDEDGSSAWMGNGSADIVGANANAKADMDNFLELLAEQYYKTATNAIRTAFPNNLVFGSGALNAQTYPQILQAAGKYLDVIEIWAEPVFQANSSVLGSAYNLSGKPLEIWTTLTSQGETSANGGTAWGTGPCTGDYDFCTQALRGAGYQSLINTYLNTKGSDGTFPIIGLDWWEYTDKVTGGENMNFGLVSSRDNAYDGIEDHSGNQPCLPENVTAGFNCGGEPGNYGNFIGPVTTANTSVYSMLASQINGISLPPVTITTPPTIVSNPPVVITTIPVSTTSPVIPPLSVVNNQNSTSGGGGSPGNPTNINTTTTPQKIYNFGTTTLRYGNKNGAVKELQMFLNYKFNLHLVVDGKFGSKTLILVKKWQTANNLTPDGIVGLKTKAKMNASV
jgi:hypothetical protein